MVATDARPVPFKGAAFRVTFPILDADGDPVAGALGLDSEVSKDGATFADCTSEATEIAAASGIYFLDLTAAEMSADTVAVRVQTTSVGAKTTVLVLYPQEVGDIRVEVQSFTGCRSGTIVSSTATQTTIEAAASAVTDFYKGMVMVLTGGTGAGQARIITFYLGATRSVSVTTAWITTPDATTTYQMLPADSATLLAAIAAVQADTDNIQTRLPAALVTGRMDSNVTVMNNSTINAATFGLNAINAAALAADAVAEIQAGLATAASVAGITTAVAAVQTDVDNLQTRLPAALTAGGKMSSDAEAIDGSTDAADRLQRSAETIGYGVVGGGSTPTSVVTSSLSPPAVAADQFKGRVLLFARNTTTAALRGQATTIAASSAAGVLTVAALTVAPATGDLFSIC